MTFFLLFNCYRSDAAKALAAELRSVYPRLLFRVRAECILEIELDAAHANFSEQDVRQIIKRLPLSEGLPSVNYEGLRDEEEPTPARAEFRWSGTGNTREQAMESALEGVEMAVEWIFAEIGTDWRGREQVDVETRVIEETARFNKYCGDRGWGSPEWKSRKLSLEYAVELSAIAIKRTR